MSVSETPLQLAQKCLRIADVYLRKSSLSSSDEYEHRSVDAEALRSQYHHVVEKSEVLVEEDGGDGLRLFRVHVDLAVRWGLVPSSEASAEDQQSNTDVSEDSFNELGRIAAHYVAEYELTEDVARECLDAFALQNASYHIWPYWREYVATSCARMNVPKIVMPTIQAAQNRDCEESEQSRG